MGNEQSSYSELRRGEGFFQTGWGSSGGGFSREQNPPRRTVHERHRPPRPRHRDIFDVDDGSPGGSASREHSSNSSGYRPPEAPMPPNWDDRRYAGGDR